jgi:hypothetical protein
MMDSQPPKNLPRCFVISPIGDYGSEIRAHMDTVFHCIIAPALGESYHVQRGDHDVRPGRITEQLVGDILGNDLIVCVLTGNNPNVYYELAIAESAAKPIIVLRHRGDVVPFDVKDVRYIEYDLDPRRIFDRVYIEQVRNAERELRTGPPERKVAFAPSLTPLGREVLNFRSSNRYSSLSPGIRDILETAEEYFYFCGISLRGWTNNEGFTSLVFERGVQAVDVRFLLMGRDNDALVHMLNRGVERNLGTVQSDIEASANALRQLAASMEKKPRVRVRTVSHGILYSQMAMSEKEMIWAPYLYSRQTGDSPALRVRAPGPHELGSGLAPLFTAMRDEFTRLWDEGDGD